jgi:hypothetical protein
MFYLVEFACFKDSPIQNILLNEETYDRWCMCEPREGYKLFKVIWKGEIEQIYIQDFYKENIIIK